jgi:hypothetical protein
MLLLPHTLFAASIVTLIPNPYLSWPLALISHFGLDFLVIHWNPHLYTEHSKNGKVSKKSLIVISSDALLSLSFCFYILIFNWGNWQKILLFGIAIFLAVLPDLVKIPYYFFHIKKGLLKKYVDFEHNHQSKEDFFWGLTTQVIVCLASLVIFFKS